MAVQRAVCIVRNESLLKQVFIVEPTTPVEEFRRMIAEKFQHEVEELDLLLQNATCPLLTIDASLPTLSDTGIIFDLEARNNIMLLPKKKKQCSTTTTVVKTRARKRGDFTGLVNNTNTCYLNCFLQSLYMTPEFRNAVFLWDIKGEDANLLVQLQKLFLLMQVTRTTALSTREFTYSFTWSRSHSRDQQDVQELLTALFDNFEECLKQQKLPNIIEQLYEGKMKSFIVCGKCESEKSQPCMFRDIQLPINDLKTNLPYTNIEEALRGYICPEDLTESNQYFCEKCQLKTDSKKGLKLLQLPYILNLSLMRFAYDIHTGRSIKINAKVEFPKILKMDEYMSSDAEDAEKGVEYELFSAIVHCGTPEGGHYYAYIKEFDHKDWYSFNDENVYQVNEDLLERAYGGSTSSNAYMITYRRLDNSRNQKTMRPVNFPSNLKRLMQEYLEDNSENVYVLNVYVRKNAQQPNDLISHKFYMNGESTFQELINDVYHVFSEYVKGLPMERCRLISYNPIKNRLERTMDSDKKFNEAVKFFDISNLLFKDCPHLVNTMNIKENKTCAVRQEIEFPLWDTEKPPAQADRFIILMNSKFLSNYSFDGRLILNSYNSSAEERYYNILISGVYRYVSKLNIDFPAVDKVAKKTPGKKTLKRKLQPYHTLQSITEAQNSVLCFRHPELKSKRFQDSVFIKLAQMYSFFIAEGKGCLRKYNFYISYNIENRELNLIISKLNKYN